MSFLETVFKEYALAVDGVPEAVVGFQLALVVGRLLQQAQCLGSCRVLKQLGGCLFRGRVYFREEAQP